MKRCFKCNQEKELDDFYVHKAMKDGHLNKCKECTKRDVKQYREDNSETLQVYEKYRSQLPHRKELDKLIHQRWKKQFPERRKAHEILGNAVRDGKVVPQVCFICGNKAEAHHPDYSRPLDVVWLCSKHHKETHKLV